MVNPYEVIDRRLSAIESVLQELRQQKNAPKSLNSVTPAAEPISPDELCKRLNISKPTAWAWEKKGVIRGYHLGNRRYYIWQEVMAAMQGRGQVA